MLDCYFGDDIDRATASLLEVMARAEQAVLDTCGGETSYSTAYLRGYRDAIRAVRIAFGVDMVDSDLRCMPPLRRRIEVRRG